jgi:uncharacterized protein YndB with AHSA1/START domain
MTDTMRLRIRILAPAGAVYHALTDPEELRAWLAEHVEVDLPDRYEFWGRYTPDGDVPRQRLLHVDDRSLRFSWTLGGTDTTVEIGLSGESDDETILSLSQSPFPTWEEALAEPGVRSQLHTFWALALANLVDHVEGRELTARCDLTSPEMSARVTIDAAPGAVFHSLTDADTFATWFGARAGIEPHLGGRFAMGGFELNPAPAKIIDLEPDHTLTLRWPDGLVTHWELEDSAGKTRLTIVQSGFDDTNPPYGGWMGWLGGVAELRRFHELPDWRPVWLSLEVPGLPDSMLTIG